MIRMNFIQTGNWVKYFNIKSVTLKCTESNSLSKIKFSKVGHVSKTENCEDMLRCHLDKEGMEEGD